MNFHLAKPLFFIVSVLCSSAGVSRADDWSGIYVGGHLGGAKADADWTLVPAGVPERVSGQPDGFVGGGQLGAQFQYDRWVPGLEVSYTAADLDDSRVSTAVADRSRETSVENLFLVSARLGYAFDRSLVYAKAGYASADIDLETHEISTGTLSGTSSGREDGWHVGAGFEYKLTSNVSAGLDYTFIDLSGDNRHNVQLTGFGAADHDDIDVEIHMLTARLNFRFGDEQTSGVHIN